MKTVKKIERYIGKKCGPMHVKEYFFFKKSVLSSETHLQEN